MSILLHKRISPFVGFTLAVGCILAVGVYALISGYISEIESRRQLMAARGQTVLDALKAGILAHGRMGRYRGDRLGVIFEELAKTPDLIALQLRGPDGAVLASGGNASEIVFPLPASPWQLPDRLILANDFTMPVSGGMGRRAQEEIENWNLFPQGTSTLIVLMNTSKMQEAIRWDRLQLAISVLITLMALGLGVLAVYLLLRRAHLADALEREREQSKRQEQIAHLGAGLAHETKNPLGIIRGLAQSMSTCASPECPGRECAKTIVDEVDRVIRGINDFLVLARPREIRLEPVELDAFFAHFLPLVQMDASAADVHVQYTPSGITILADREQLRRAVLNLLLNAFRASRAKDTITIQAERKGAMASFTIADTGCGIAPEDLAQVTTPYFTRSQGGSGLGLTMVDQIATAHNWQLGIESIYGKGTQVHLDGIRVIE